MSVCRAFYIEHIHRRLKFFARLFFRRLFADTAEYLGNILRVADASAEAETSDGNNESFHIRFS